METRNAESTQGIRVEAKEETYVEAARRGDYRWWRYLLGLVIILLAWMVLPQMMIPNSSQRFDRDGNLTDEETRQRLRRFLAALREWTGRLGSAGRIENADVG